MADDPEADDTGNENAVYDDDNEENLEEESVDPREAEVMPPPGQYEQPPSQARGQNYSQGQARSRRYSQEQPGRQNYSSRPQNYSQGPSSPQGFNQVQSSPQGYGPQIYLQPTSYHTVTMPRSVSKRTPRRPRYSNKYVGTDDEDDNKSMVSEGNSIQRRSIEGSLINLHPIRNGLLLKFYQIATLQGRISYFLMSVYVINSAVYDSWFGGTVLYPYLFANMVYGYTFVIFTRIHFLTMPMFPRMLWSFLGSVMFSFASCITFQWVADNWGGKSPYPRVLVATILSVLYGRMYAGAFLSYLNYLDKKILSLVRRVYGPYILDTQ